MVSRTLILKCLSPICHPPHAWLMRNSSRLLVPKKKMKIYFQMLAFYCFERFQNSGAMDVSFYSGGKDYKYFHEQPENQKFWRVKSEELCTIVCSLQGRNVENKKACFDMYLDVYGLKLATIDFTTYPIAPCIHLKNRSYQDEHEIVDCMAPLLAILCLPSSKDITAYVSRKKPFLSCLNFPFKHMLCLDESS